MKDNIELKLVGITYNQIENGVYALILEDPIAKRRLAIVIGYPEAQSIECHLQKVKTPRPLAHDLMASILSSLGAELVKVDIHRLPTGPYAGRLTIKNELGAIMEIDARSSDAIALAVRVNAPIFTSKELLEEKGYSPQQDYKGISRVSVRSNLDSDSNTSSRWSRYSDDELEKLLEKNVAEENYETAAEIKLELEKRRSFQ